jgi:hypothetical protein
MAATYRAAHPVTAPAGHVTARPDARAHGCPSSSSAAKSPSGRRPPPAGTAAQKLQGPRQLKFAWRSGDRRARCADGRQRPPGSGQSRARLRCGRGRGRRAGPPATIVRARWWSPSWWWMSTSTSPGTPPAVGCTPPAGTAPARSVPCRRSPPGVTAVLTAARHGGPVDARPAGRARGRSLAAPCLGHPRRAPGARPNRATG